MRSVGRSVIVSVVLIAVLCALGVVGGCSRGDSKKPGAAVQQQAADVKTDIAGKTVEQKNVGRRLEDDGVPGALKHLYVISAYSGDVLVYSTVIGKVTSSGKRLRPRTLAGYSGDIGGSVMTVDTPYGNVETTELMEEDGTYGDSNPPYIYWWDTRGIYHQLYITGGLMVHVSDQPMAVRHIVLNMELTTTQGND